MLALVLAACADFNVQRKQIFLRYEPEADGIDVLLVSEGLQAGAKTDAKRVQRILHGRRDFIVWSLFELDVDREVEEQALHPIPPDEEDAELVKAWLAYQPNVVALEARALRDEAHEGRLCLLQRARLGEGAKLLRLIDRVINDSFLREPHEDDDPKTSALVRSRAETGGSWVRFDGSALVVSIPMGAEGSAAALRACLTEAASTWPMDRSRAQILQSLSAVQVADGELRLTFAPGEDGWIRFVLEDRETYDDGLECRLAALEPLETTPLEPEIERLMAR